MSKAAWMPATPPPITRARRVRGISIGARAWLKRVLATDMRDQVDGLGRSRSAVVMDPRALLANIGHFHEIRVQPFLFGRLAEGAEVHVRRAGGDDDAGEALVGDFPAYRGLPGSEHMYLQLIAQATPGNSPASAATCSTSTLRAMFSPHQQTNTPIRAMVYCFTFAERNSFRCRVYVL